MKRLFSLFLILSLASAMTMAVRTAGGDVVLSSENMVVKVNSVKNELDIGGVVKIPIFPTVTSKGETVKVGNPTETPFVAGGKTGSYTLVYSENFAGDVFASAEIEVTDDYVDHQVRLENSGESQLEVDLEIQPKGVGSYYIFAPYKRTADANYLWVSPALAEERADGLVIAFDNLRPTYDQPQEINLKNDFRRVMGWKIPLAPGEKKTIGIKYRPGYINSEDLLEGNPYSPPRSKQHILHTQSDPLIELSGAGASDSIKPEVGATATGRDVLELFRQELDALPSTPTGESTLTSLAIDLATLVTAGRGLNSIEKALLFRDMARGQGIPCELVVGMKDNNYYGWAVAYVGGTKLAYDPMGLSANYPQVYKEPEVAICDTDLHSCPWSSGIRTDQFCLGPLCISAYVLIALFALVCIAVFAVFQYKTDLVYQILGTKKGKSMLEKDTLEAEYEIINEKFVPKSPLETAVWDAVRRRGGTFNTEDYTTETGFSEVLVKSMIESFVENGVLKRLH